MKGKTMGTWCIGYGSTPDEAILNAKKAAIDLINSRGKGCLGGKNISEPFQYLGVQNGRHKARVHASHHNGSCGQQSAWHQWFDSELRKLGSRLLGRI